MTKKRITKEANEITQAKKEHTTPTPDEAEKAEELIRLNKQLVLENNLNSW